MPSIVYTRPDGGVSVCTPASTAMRFMTNGGGRWDGLDPGFVDRQIAEQAKYGVGERAAARFVKAMQYGGCTDAIAYEIMRDRYCSHLGTGCELWDADELFLDRWFRDAWRRSHNGGPIMIDVPTARQIQYKLIKALSKESGVKLSLPRWRERIRRASKPEQIKAIFPVPLSCHLYSAKMGKSSKAIDRS